jgi:hypothetical protein
MLYEADRLYYDAPIACRCAGALRDDNRYGRKGVVDKWWSNQAEMVPQKILKQGEERLRLALNGRRLP